MTLVVLGGAPAQRQAIEAAAQQGIATVVCDSQPGVGDVEVSSEDTAGVKRVAEQHGATGLIAPGTDWPVRIAAYVAEDLGLAHPLTVPTAVLCTNKLAQREAFAAAGVPQPEWSAERPPSYPCVVKAPDRQGQRAMTMAASEAEAEAAEPVARRGSRSGRVVFEAFVPGPEVTVNGFSVDGWFVPVAVAAREHFPGVFGVAQRHVYPSGLDDDAAAAAAEAAVTALGITDGPSYVQMILSAEGPRIMEVAARLGGGHDSEICRRAAGVDLAGAAVRLAVGRPVDAEELVPQPRGACVIEFLRAPEGVLRATGGPAEATFYHPPGHRYGPLHTATDRAGYVIAEGTTRQEALERARTAVAAVGIRGRMSSAIPAALAIEGGTPVRDSMLSFSPPVLGDEEIASVIETLRSGWLTSGPRTRELEERFAARAHARHAIATSSCTAALHLALVAAGLGEGDEVITSSFTWPATVNAVLHAGATPVFADVHPGTLNIDPESVRALVGPATRAILPVHFAGGPCDMDAICAIARDHSLLVVEDAAHAVEATVGDRRVGSIGDYTCFSLYATKSLAGGEGGVVTTGSDEGAEQLRLLRSQGITRDPWRRQQSRSLGHYDVTVPGFKANLADLQAAVALPKFDRLEMLYARRSALVEQYDRGLADLAGIEPIERPPFGRHAHHLYVVRVDPEEAGGDRDRYAAALMAENIATGLHFLPVHTLTWYRENLRTASLPATEAAGETVLSLPLGGAHTERDVDDVLAAVRKLHAAFTR